MARTPAARAEREGSHLRTSVPLSTPIVATAVHPAEEVGPADLPTIRHSEHAIQARVRPSRTAGHPVTVELAARSSPHHPSQSAPSV